MISSLVKNTKSKTSKSLESFSFNSGASISGLKHDLPRLPAQQIKTSPSPTPPKNTHAQRREKEGLQEELNRETTC